ncbi:DUF3606 domain-containing protein [Azorhizobium sp. AG788]|uniref:DUF3606 domain-containing protein n=1 Tax=Azorhizobium sp. AG788 TaxID=2183897 RepID=UPI00313899A4
MDQDRIGGGPALAPEDHEAAYFAKAAGISRDDARLLIRRHGTHRATLLAAARKLKYA